MAKNVKVRLNRSGVRDLLRSADVRADLERRAARIKAASGSGYETDSEIGKNRARASVRTADMRSIRDNAKHNTLIRAMDSGR